MAAERRMNDTLLRVAPSTDAQAQRGSGGVNADLKNCATPSSTNYLITAMREHSGGLRAHCGSARTALRTIDGARRRFRAASKPTQLSERPAPIRPAHAVFARAAKDYHTVLLSIPSAAEAKPAGSALSQLMHALGKEIFLSRV